MRLKDRKVYTMVFMSGMILSFISCCSSQPIATPSQIIEQVIVTDSDVTSTLEPVGAIPSISLEPMITPTAPISTETILFAAQDGYLYNTDTYGCTRNQIVLLTENPDGDDAFLGFYLSRAPIMSPDGHWLVINDGRWQWSLVNLDEKKVVAEGKGEKGRLSPTWAPNNLAFAYIGVEDKLCIYSLSDSTETCVYQAEDALLRATWSPDGEAIAVIVGECCEPQVWMINLKKGTNTLIDTVSVSFESLPKFELSWIQPSDGEMSWLLIKEQQDQLKASVYTSGGVLLQHFDRVILDLSRDGEYALYPNLSGGVGKVNGDIFYTPYSERESETLIQDWAWSPDGEQLAFLTTNRNSEDGGFLLSVVNLTAESLLWQMEFSEPFQTIYWSIDGQYLFLDVHDLKPNDSPIWRLAADGKSNIEVVVDEGILIGVLP